VVKPLISPPSLKFARIEAHREPRTFRATFHLAPGFKIMGITVGEDTVNAFLRFRISNRLITLSALTALTLLCAASALAQGGTMSPNQDEQDGISAGGKWMQFKSEDKMSGASRIRFELVSDNYFREDPEYKPRVELFCEAGKLKTAEFNPGVKLPPPNRPGFWGQPQLEVEVRIDDYHTYHGWNWGQRGHYLSMDKGTVRGMMGAQVFKIALPTRSGRQIAEFSPAGLDVNQLRQACDLKPEKP
jgi:hypothetical protein